MHSRCKTVLHRHLIKIHQFATSPHLCKVILKLFIWHGWMIVFYWSIRFYQMSTQFYINQLKNINQVQFSKCWCTHLLNWSYFIFVNERRNTISEAYHIWYSYASFVLAVFGFFLNKLFFFLNVVGLLNLSKTQKSIRVYTSLPRKRLFVWFHSFLHPRLIVLCESTYKSNNHNYYCW
jgi:hypothetical protein